MWGWFLPAGGAAPLVFGGEVAEAGKQVVEGAFGDGWE